METQVKKLPAAADPATQDMLRRSLNELAGELARRTNGLGDAIESQRHETPLLVATADNSAAPASVPGMLWFVVSSGLLCYYDAAYDQFMEAAFTVDSGNNNVVNISGSIYAITRVRIPANVFLESVNVAFFSPGNLTGRLDAYSVGGNSLGSIGFSVSAGNFGEATLTLNKNIAAAFGLEVRVTLFSGSIPEVAGCARYRRRP